MNEYLTPTCSIYIDKNGERTIISSGYETCEWNDLNNIEEEIGDLLITIVNLARFFDISADLALKKTNQKFYNRFNFIEKIVKKNNQKIEDISLAELLNYWEKAKNEEK